MKAHLGSVVDRFIHSLATFNLTLATWPVTEERMPRKENQLYGAGYKNDSAWRRGGVTLELFANRR